ncbi:MAG: hypothetical protein HQM03_02335 [Magnetococcales bacterium]|nr:hypothetical protein [Magnetococcales bacterium]
MAGFWRHWLLAVTFWLPVFCISLIIYLLASNKILILFLAINILAWGAAIRWGAGVWFLQIRLLYGMLLAVELAMQGLAFLHGLPGLNVKHDVPFGRVYWTKEGDGVNATMNRFGWYAVESVPRRDMRRIVLIGDSMVEGVQVEKREKLDVRMQSLLGGTQVFSLGLSGAYPGTYLEMVRHAIKFYNPHEIIIFITVWNDFRNALPELNAINYSYIYYDLAPGGELVALPGTREAIQALHAHMESNRNPSFFLLVESARGHLLVPWMVRKWFADSRKSAPHARGAGEGRFGAGVDGAIYRKEPDALTQKAYAINFKLLEQCLALARAHGATLRLVAIPHFPEFFHAAASDAAWSTDFGDMDLLLPERKIGSFAAEHAIPFLPGGQRMLEQGVGRGMVYSWYARGVGHWTVAGHEQFARMLLREWYVE